MNDKGLIHELISHRPERVSIRVNSIKQLSYEKMTALQSLYGHQSFAIYINDLNFKNFSLIEKEFSSCYSIKYFFSCQRQKFKEINLVHGYSVFDFTITENSNDLKTLMQETLEKSYGKRLSFIPVKDRPEEIKGYEKALVNCKSLVLKKDQRLQGLITLTPFEIGKKKQDFEKIGLDISVRDISVNQFLKIIYGDQKKYHLTVIVLGTKREEYIPFFQYLAGEKKIINYEIKEIETIFKKLKKEDHWGADKIDYVNRLNQLMADNFIVLPLFQQTRTFYYPKKIKGMHIGEGFLGHPQIAEIEL